MIKIWGIQCIFWKNVYKNKFWAFSSSTLVHVHHWHVYRYVNVLNGFVNEVFVRGYLMFHWINVSIDRTISRLLHLSDLQLVAWLFPVVDEWRMHFNVRMLCRFCLNAHYDSKWPTSSICTCFSLKTSAGVPVTGWLISTVRRFLTEIIVELLIPLFKYEQLSTN